MPYDDKAFAELVEQSQDTQPDAMANIAEPVDELVELHFERAARGELDVEANQRFAAAHRGAVDVNSTSANSTVPATNLALRLLGAGLLLACRPVSQAAA